jgi:nitroimidazol reductase NimA-like FMN-containing flavoprotein (pyridoxamine 5'-phosphate oxidase superfamily)
MRDMTKEEIMEFIKEWTWGTLIGIEGDKPNAIEVSYGTDGKFIYCGSMPGGGMARGLQANNNVAFKICDADRSCKKWRAVIIEGNAERLTNYDGILYSVRAIARQRGFPENTYDAIAEKVSQNQDSNSIRIPIKVIAGKTSG